MKLTGLLCRCSVYYVTCAACSVVAGLLRHTIRPQPCNNHWWDRKGLKVLSFNSKHKERIEYNFVVRYSIIHDKTDLLLNTTVFKPQTLNRSWPVFFEVRGNVFKLQKLFADPTRFNTRSFRLSWFQTYTMKKPVTIPEHKNTFALYYSHWDS
jgi:hypothetical protein